jgi:hypothetical protein
MSTLLFFATVIIVVVLGIGIIAKAIRRKSMRKKARLLGVVVAAYALLWVIFLLVRREQTLPFGTDVCFDDWCATVEGMDTVSTLGTGPQESRARGIFVVLHVKMSNHARGIAQKPSEPRIHIIDGEGDFLTFSKEGQQALESTEGKQKDIGERLELQESLETKIVFDVPKNERGLKAMIEEGPFITKFLLPEDRAVFLLKVN